MIKSTILLFHNSPTVRRTSNFILILLGMLFIPIVEMSSQTYWVPLNCPTHHDLRRLSFLDGLNGWVAGDSGTILRTTGGGQAWIQQNTGIAEDIRAIFMLNDRRGWALAPWFSDTTYGTILLSTTNGGNVWQSEPWMGEYFTSIYFKDSLVGWLASGRIFKTTNGGTTWTASGQLSTPIFNLRFFSADYGFAMGGVFDLFGAVLRTTNAGETWTTRNVAPGPVYDLCYLDSLNIIGVSGGDFAGIITTTNGGDNWELRSPNIFGQPLALAVRTPAEMWSPLGFARTYMYTLDSGATWTSLSTPDTTQVYDAAFTDEQTGYMVGSQGTVLKYDHVTHVADRQLTHPMHCMLHQNYPNPFNPATVIRYTLPATCIVNLKVHNVLGQEVATLVNQEMEPGSYDVKWEASSFSSGVYFYRLTAGNFVETRKLILLK